ncbi:MFS transporter [Histoplasma capsulatum var. duboisii H88]|uniref:MFS transporter n=1 Tax=Ajellomyces capsulatus (strain H88) TaxID=544711 RepID=F0UVA7_AJEC8|nr:MFS transporter [Histoplasma capsulatum var. duboisii H88]QSS50957.1 MFS transporter [Histoplasma capsulatum var. duboisii H88]
MPSTPNPTRRRRMSAQTYHTFSTPPPKSRGRPLSSESTLSSSNGEAESSVTESPLPTEQMAILAVIALCEQTAFNSISPYIPHMTASFPNVSHGQVGMYVGVIASAFALAQFATNFFWGWVSDRIGRKPVILLGTILSAGCFLAFGFCKTLWQAIVVQALLGIVNGNQGVVSTCLGEITDRSNQSRAFTYLPVIYGIGGVTGPIIGGLLVSKSSQMNENYPYLTPNIVSAVILTLDFTLASLFLQESLENSTTLPKLEKKMRELFTWLWQFTSSSRPTYLQTPRPNHQHHSPSAERQSYSSVSGEETDADIDSSSATPNTGLFHLPNNSSGLERDEIFNRDTVLLLITYLIFALTNVAFNSLYPIFGQAALPTGRELSPGEIGLSLAFASIVSIAFQICIFGRLRDKMGNKWSYRASLLGFVISFILMPFVGYKDDAATGGEISKSTILLAIELCVVLLVKTVAAVGGLTSALLLITNSVTNTHALGSLNGLAQTLSALGRAVGPFLSGSLFTLATRIEPKGEAMAFGVFGGVAFLGFLLSFGIKANKLEAAGFVDHDSADHYKSDDEETLL